MPEWTPTQDAPDTRKVAPNLLAFIGANNAAAIRWANGGTSLPAFKRLWESAEGRIHKYFPDLMILRESVNARDAAQGIDVDYELLLELQVTGKAADAVTRLAKTYIAAVESMLVNIPPEILVAGTTLGMPRVQELGHDLGQEGKLSSQYFRAPRVRIRWTFSEMNYG